MSACWLSCLVTERDVLLIFIITQSFTLLAMLRTGFYLFSMGDDGQNHYLHCHIFIIISLSFPVFSESSSSQLHVLSTRSQVTRGCLMSLCWCQCVPNVTFSGTGSRGRVDRILSATYQDIPDQSPDCIPELLLPRLNPSPKPSHHVWPNPQSPYGNSVHH